MQQKEKIQSNIFISPSPLASGSPPTLLQPSINEHDKLNSSQTKSIKWSTIETQLFCIFWLRKLLQNPYQVISFKNPLGRKNHNKQLSQFLAQSSYKINRSQSQCKSKYSTFKRNHIKQVKAAKKKDPNYESDFIDYIKKIARQKLKQRKNQELQNLLAEVESDSFKNQKSQLMKVTEQLIRFQEEECAQLYQNLSGYHQRKKDEKKREEKRSQAMNSYQ